jgi:hypothetical protein
MAAISYSIATGGNLETVTAGTNAPSGGNGTVEIRIDTTTTAITDASVSGGTRAQKKGEAFAAIRTLLEYLIRDTNMPE